MKLGSTTSFTSVAANDELNTYVFDVAPKQIVGKKRYFQGRIWVDDHDFQIVRDLRQDRTRHSQGKKGQENLFPKFTTWREQMDGQYWFPTYTTRRGHAEVFVE